MEKRPEVLRRMDKGKPLQNFATEFDVGILIMSNSKINIE